MVKKKGSLSEDALSNVSQITSVSSEHPGRVSKMKKKSGISSELVSVMKTMAKSPSKGKEKYESQDSVTVPELGEANSSVLANTAAVQNSSVPVNHIKKEVKFKKKMGNFDSEEEERTIFVGNVDINNGKRKLATLFSKYGSIETIRLRSVAPSQPEISKKEAVIKKNVHHSRNTLNAYIRFKTKDMMEAALEANGTVLLGNHLRVDRATQRNNHDRHCAVFVGNLPFECEDEELYKHFEDCGDIESVRIIRDKKFSSGKGFGYVNFKSSHAVEVALQLDGKLFKNRNLRIQRCIKKEKQHKKREKSMPQEGQAIGFMRVKGSQRLSLKFMKTQKRGGGKKGIPGKNDRKQKSGNKPMGKFSGKEMIESKQFKKMKKNKKRPSKEDKKKMFLSRHLTGRKLMK